MFASSGYLDNVEQPDLKLCGMAMATGFVVDPTILVRSSAQLLDTKDSLSVAGVTTFEAGFARRRPQSRVSGIRRKALRTLCQVLQRLATTPSVTLSSANVLYSGQRCAWLQAERQLIPNTLDEQDGRYERRA
jgi:hypothetical protein